MVVFSTEDKVQGGPNLEGCLYTYSKFEHQEQFASYCTKTCKRNTGTARRNRHLASDDDQGARHEVTYASRSENI